MLILRCQILASQSAETADDINPRLPDTHIYKFDAPEGYEDLVGRGILFMDDWHLDGVVSRVEILGLASDN